MDWMYDVRKGQHRYEGRPATDAEYEKMTTQLGALIDRKRAGGVLAASPGAVLRVLRNKVCPPDVCECPEGEKPSSSSNWPHMTREIVKGEVEIIAMDHPRYVAAERLYEKLPAEMYTEPVTGHWAAKHPVHVSHRMRLRPLQSLTSYADCNCGQELSIAWHEADWSSKVTT